MKNKIEPKDVRDAIAKLRRRRGIESDDDIDITMIAKEVGCTRNTLYQERFKKIIAPFQKIKKKTDASRPQKGSVEYFKNIIKNREASIKDLTLEVSRLKDNLIDDEVILGSLQLLEEENEELKNRLSDCYKEDQVKRLAGENAKLREILLRSGLDVQI